MRSDDVDAAPDCLRRYPLSLPLAAIKAPKLSDSTAPPNPAQRFLFMANRKHLDLFENSNVEEWNKWKQGHPLLRIDLSGVELEAADLSGANRSVANLSGAYFYEANRSSDVGRLPKLRQVEEKRRQESLSTAEKIRKLLS
jgi:uncharacterized protein YjbI with pentapeptide repeats